MASTRQIVERYYNEMWNRWQFELVPELLTPKIRFRGSLGVEVVGHDAFLRYMKSVHAAFPDFHNRIDDLLIDWNRAAVRLSYTGTHSGPLFGIEPTGRQIRYQGIAIFTIAGERIESGWVLGDTLSLYRQIGHEVGPKSSQT